MHEQLVRMTEAQDPRLLGPGNAALPKVLAVFTEVLGHGTRLVEGETGLRMARLLHQLQASVPGGSGVGRERQGRTGGLGRAGNQARGQFGVPRAVGSDGQAGLRWQRLLHGCAFWAYARGTCVVVPPN